MELHSVLVADVDSGHSRHRRRLFRRRSDNICGFAVLRFCIRQSDETFITGALLRYTFSQCRGSGLIVYGYSWLDVIAEDIKAQLLNNSDNNYFEKIDVVSGYLNFFVDKNALIKADRTAVILHGICFQQHALCDKLIIIKDWCNAVKNMIAGTADITGDL